MDQRKKHRQVLRAAFTKSANELEKLLSTEAAPQQVHVVWEVLSQKQENLLIANREIYDSLLQEDVSEDDLMSEMESCEGYGRKLIDLRITYENYRKKHEITVLDDGASTTTTTGRRKFRLPTIEFKKFSGEIRDWLSFWGQFKKINDDPNIDTSDKFQYLIQATAYNSRARQLVESFPSIAENYEKVIDSLISRFGRKDLQIEVYVRELLKLVINNAMSNEKNTLSTLYDKLETQLRALESLGVKNDNCSAMLFPLIESCLPEDLLRVWQRSPHFSSSIPVSVSETKSEASLTSSTMSRLKGLMRFLQSEVENEERISLAAEGFGLTPGENRHKKSNKQVSREIPIPTAAGLMNCDFAKCIFCEGKHGSENCFKAHNFSLEQKRNISIEKKACFRCLKTGHQTRKCHERLKCILCSKPHVALMCPELPANRSSPKQKSSKVDTCKTENLSVEQSLASYTNTHVFLQTLQVKMISEHGVRLIRAVIDTGSQRSYVLRSAAEKLRYKPKRTERIIHSLFGGSNTAEQFHNCYDIRLKSGSGNYSCSFEVLDQNVICNEIGPIFHGCWMEELQEKNIRLSDVHDSAPIELLIGADVAGKLYTGRRYILKCGLVAVQTLLGWTLMGKIPSYDHSSNIAMTVLSLFVKNANIADLWELDVLGISEPAEKRSREEMDNAAKELFLQTITTDIEGSIPDNYALAKKRLTSALKKLRTENLCGSYNNVFDEWLREGIIEEVTSFDLPSHVHYLPHRPVIKENSSTTESFYVDNCVTSVPDEETLQKFVRESSILMSEAKFDLRGWEHTKYDSDELVSVHVLGLNWNTNKDTLSIQQENISKVGEQIVTKKTILSRAQQIFNPIGFTCPASLCPKLLLQRTWEKRLNWDSISKFASVQRINWHFNPPAAPWWGGFWEGLVGVLKQLLRKVLGRTSLFYEDLLTVLCDCEAVINSRPLTYLSGDSEDLVTLYPAMFLRDQAECRIPDCDVVDETSLSRKMIYKQKLRTMLRRRFRNEYLGQLRSMVAKKKCRQVVLGEIVLVSDENHKRLDWPLGRIIELIAGKDNKIRLVRVKTARGSLIRPVQKVYPLELIDSSGSVEDSTTEVREGASSRVTFQDKFLPCSSEQNNSRKDEVLPKNCDSVGVTDIISDIESRATNKVKCTRSGRQIKTPKRFVP